VPGDRRDYVRKCGFRKALVGLSGGIDSALVAAIAVEALGAENVLEWECPASSLRPARLTTRGALTVNLGIRYELVAIHDVFTAYQRTLGPLFAGTPFGLAEENLQSRIRGGLLMAAVEQVWRAGADHRKQERDCPPATARCMETWWARWR